MTTKPYAKLVHERRYIAEVDVDLIQTDVGWSPYLSHDDVREALRHGDVKADVG